MIGAIGTYAGAGAGTGANAGTGAGAVVGAILGAGATANSFLQTNMMNATSKSTYAANVTNTTNANANATATTILMDTFSEQYQSQNQNQYRFLGGGSGETIDIDYTIFAMAVMTMGLLLVVEVIRYMIDVLARGNDFFETVLRTVYHELSTLGIVEATIFTVHKYYDDLDLEKERIFADVHFALFFVAIINALMSCILYALAFKLAESRWVKMEQLDINHYVAFRKQFDQVKEKIDFLDRRTSKGGTKDDGDGGGGNAGGHSAPAAIVTAKQNDNSSSSNKSEETGESTGSGSGSNGNHNDNQKASPSKSKRSPLNMADSERQVINSDFFRDNDGSVYETEHQYEYDHESQRGQARKNNNMHQDPGNTNYVSFIGSVLNKPSRKLPFGQHNLIRGILQKKHAELLIRLRFHELRVHFIENHNLKYNFRVSDYLKLAMNDVFKDFVHISTRTWIALMGFANLLYFLMGIITVATAPPLLPSQQRAAGSDGNDGQYEEFTTTEYQNKVPIALSSIYIGYCGAFIFISYFISRKMGNIFLTVIEKDSWIQVTDRSSRNLGVFDSAASMSSVFTNATEQNKNIGQRDYFWFGKPDLIITFAQLMQFGYSVGLAILLVFSKTVKSGNVFGWWGWYAVTPAVCFLLFVWLWSDIILDYTQCTNLGELVNKKHLVDVDARSKLEEERYRRQEEIDHFLAEKEIAENMEKRTMKRTKPRKVRMKTRSSMSLESMQVDESLMQISEFVKKRTKDLPARVRIKSTSSGVVTMRSYGDENIPKPSGETYDAQSKDGKALNSTIKISNLKYQVQDDNTSSTKKISLEEKLRRLYLSKEYRQVSAVFGTMVAIYLIAFRIQTILVKTCRMKDNENVWDFTLNFSSAFWILFIWFWLFIVESFLTVVLFLREKGRENFYMVFAGSSDIILSSICLGLLVMAEIQRCCDCGSDDANHSYSSLSTSHNVFAGATVSGTANDNSYSSSSCSTNSCCPQFGSRLCGGIGEIEPIASIIALRLLRFFASHQICRHLEVGRKSVVKFNLNNSNEIVERNQFSDTSNQNGNIAELWILALTEYSDIAKKHGIFSGFLLEAMLGISQLPEGQISTKNLLGPAIGSGITFERPYSQLIRSMRRCYSKYKPLLDDEWHLIDVVLTKNELVWFDTKIENTKLSPSEIEAMQSTQDMMKRTNGGVNIRLCDISMGRTVLGRFSLSDLQYVKVQRPSLQQQPLNKINDREVDLPESDTNHISDSMLRFEYWFSASTGDNDDALSTLEQRGLDHSKIDDTLKLSTSHGTLFLKFIADIKQGAEEEVTGQQEKVNEAMMWCENIFQIQHELPVTPDTIGNPEATVEIINEGENQTSKKSILGSFRIF